MNEPAAAARGPNSWLPPALAAAVVLHAASGSPSWLVSIALVGACLVAMRRGPRWPAALALAAALVQLASQAHADRAARAWPERARAWVGERADRLRHRHQQLIADVRRAASDVAALPETRPSLSGDETARSRLFTALATRHDATRAAYPEPIAFAVHRSDGTRAAWAGPVAPPPRSAPDADTQVFLMSGTITTTLVAVAPIRTPRGFAGLSMAELPLAARRNIQNAFLFDFDLLAEADPRVEIRYRQGPAGPETASRPAPGAIEATGVLAGPDGTPWADFRIVPAPLADELGALRQQWHTALVTLAVLAWVAWAVHRRRHGPFGLGDLLLAAAAVRLLLWALPIALPGWGAAFLSSSTYASALTEAWPAPLGRLLGTPLDLLLTSAWAALAALWLAAKALRSPGWLPPAAGFVADAAGLAVIAGTFLWLSDLSFQSRFELDQVRLMPRPTYAMLQAAGLLIIATGGLLLFVVQSIVARPPRTASAHVARAAAAIVVAVLAYSYWPRHVLGLPLVPAAALFALAATAAATRERWQGVWHRGTLGARAGLVVGAAVAAQLVLHPSLVHYGEKNRRLQIEGESAGLVRQQPEWREGLLAEARRQIDALRVLEAPPAEGDRGHLGELAFAVWSRTELAAQGFSSAVEIQDHTGAVVSRFALNLPSVSSGPLAMPKTDTWTTDWETVRLVSANRPARHAQRRLVYDGQLRGAIHVYAADDYWNLPFLEPRDPYPTLFRSASLRTRRDRTVHLAVYEGRSVVFASADRPPGLSDALVQRLAETPRGFWTTLSYGPVAHHVFLFTEGSRTFGLSFARSGPAPYAANLVEAAAGTALTAAVVVLVVLTARSLFGRRTFTLQTLGGAMLGPFSARLFVAFIALAIVSVAVLQFVTRSYLVERLRLSTERQGLQRAETAQKAVEDFAYFQRGDAPGDEPVTDAALVWVASLIRNDADLFRGGSIAASSKRELYASRLLGPTVSGPVYRSLVLDGEPAAIRTERIGGFSYLVASVPVSLDRGEPAILSIPLALRQREVQTIVEDLDRTIRLASLLFLAGAALLAHRLARRISGPIRALTAATDRIARGDLEARVAVGGRDELRQLVESFNRMTGDLDRQRRELERSNRLAAWAEMARQVAHEVKNPLTPIQLSTQHLRRVYRDANVDFEAALETCTSTILEQVRKLREIATEFSSFARPPAAALHEAKLAELVEEAVAPYRASLPGTVALEVRVANPVPPVRVDRRLFDRALVNLVENALQAVGEAGRIQLSVRNGTAGRAEVEVADSGPGIDPAVRDRIFEPFFSTKTSGSGLGLALVKKILEDHGGGVDLRSTPGEGTRVVIWLPAVETKVAVGG